jgi:cytidylate kinase
VRLDDEARLVALVSDVELVQDAHGRHDRVVIGGRDVTAEARTANVDERVSEVARQPAVREAMVPVQRRLAAPGGIVMAGRDIGTVILPDADLKIYLDASVEERARRRVAERGLDPGGPEAAAILEALRERDAIDRGRAVAPLRIPDDAIVLGTDGNRFEDTVAAVVEVIRDAEARAA